MRSRAARTAIAMVAVALAGLAATSATAVVTLGHENTHITDLRAQAVEFSALREAVADIAYAEAGYRRSPGPSSWHRLEDAMGAVPDAIATVRATVGDTDHAALSNLTVLHLRYVQQIETTRDRTISAGNDRVAGPALDAMRTLVEAILTRYRTEITTATAHQASLIQRMWWLVPSAFGISFVLLTWAFVLSARERNRFADEAVTARQAAEQDPLTGLPNRIALNAALTRAASGDGSTRPALLLLDLDGFKPVNDTYGHPAGDVALQEVARRLQTCLDPGDLPARLGGDEFAVLVADGTRAEEIARRVDIVFDPAFLIEDAEVHLGASVGVAHAPTHAWAPIDLIREADRALYVVKRTRRGAPTS